MKKIPFVTAKSGHITMVSRDDIIYPDVMGLIQDTYPLGGILPPYWRIEYHRYDGAACADIYYTGIDCPAPASLLIASWGDESEYIYNSLVDAKPKPPFPGTPLLIAKLTDALIVVPPEGVLMLGDLERVLGVFLLERNVKDLNEKSHVANPGEQIHNGNWRHGTTIHFR